MTALPASPHAKNPCEDPILAKAAADGLGSLKTSEVIRYYAATWQCRFSGARTGQDSSKDLYSRKLDGDYQEAEELSGLGTFVTITASLVLTYAAAYQFLGP